MKKWKMLWIYESGLGEVHDKFNERYGNDGWKLVNVIRDGTSWVAIIQREIPEPEPQWEFYTITATNFSNFGAYLDEGGRAGWEIVNADVSLHRALMKRKLVQEETVERKLGRQWTDPLSPGP